MMCARCACAYLFQDDPREDGGPCDQVTALIAGVVDVSAGSTWPGDRTRSAQTLAVTTWVAPVSSLTLTPEIGQALQSPAGGLGGPRKTRVPRKAKPCSSVGGGGTLPRRSR
jgi:hypothetical protein